MKKYYIYLFIAILCFFSFNIGVDAQTLCKYSGDNEKDKLRYDVIVDYDKTNGFSTSLNVYSVKGNGSTKDKASMSIPFDSKYKNGFAFTSGKVGTYDNNKGIWIGKLGDGKVDGYSKSESHAVSTTDINLNKCPSYVNVFSRTDYVTGDILKTGWWSTASYLWCFADNQSSVSNNYLDCTGVLSGYSMMVNNVSGEKKTIINNNEYNIPDGKVCTYDDSNGNGIKIVESSGIKDKKVETVGKCDVRFTYNKSSGLKIEYNAGDGYKAVADDAMSIYCPTGETVNHGQGVKTDKTIKVNLSNTYLGSKNTDIYIRDRDEFNAKILKKWSENNGDCKDLVYLNLEGVKTIDGYGVGLLDSEAAEECLDNGCSGVDNKHIQSFEPFDYGWNDWYTTGIEITDCTKLLGSDAIELLNDILMYVKILVPILLIGLGVSDFIKAMISPDEQAMSKAKSKFIKRLIVAAVIFLIPTITNLIFDVVNGVWGNINNEACNIWK